MSATASRIDVAEDLSPEDVRDIRQILSDIRAGRRLACFAWKFLAILGGIALGAGTLISQFHPWGWAR